VRARGALQRYAASLHWWARRQSGKTTLARKSPADRKMRFRKRLITNKFRQFCEWTIAVEAGPVFLHSFPALLRYIRVVDQAAFLEFRLDRSIWLRRGVACQGRVGALAIVEVHPPSMTRWAAKPSGDILR